MVTPRHIAAIAVASAAVFGLGGSALIGQPTSTNAFGTAVDTYVSSAHPHDTYELSPSLKVGKDPDDVTYLRFTVTGLSGPVLSAALELYATHGAPGAALHPVARNDWTAAVTFADAPPFGPVVASRSAFSKSSWVRFDVRGVVTGNGTFSMALTSPDRGRFTSSRAGTGLAPKLTVISGVAAPGTPAPTATAAPTPTPSATASPPDATPTPTGAPSPTGTPTATPTATPGPTPTPSPPPGVGPVTRWHYTANDNYDSSGRYLPGAEGFNLADVGDKSTLDSLPAGDKGLVWVGRCSGADAGFQSALSRYAGDSRVFGFYLMDEPDPTGKYKPACPPENLKAESDWVHANLPGTKTFVILMNFSSSSSPTYQHTYNPGNTDIDLYGLDPYPCRTETNSCSYGWIPAAVSAAEAAGIPLADVVPVYQAFGYGNWVDDGGGRYMLPSATQELQLLATWGSAVPSPAFDYAYSWGSQNGDTPLSATPSLQAVFLAHNS
jgi:hypothetical protein